MMFRESAEGGTGVWCGNAHIGGMARAILIAGCRVFDTTLRLGSLGTASLSY